MYFILHFYSWLASYKKQTDDDLKFQPLNDLKTNERFYNMSILFIILSICNVPY